MNRFTHYWFSVCSAHREADPNCDLCKVGSWVFKPYHWFSSFMWEFFPETWSQWVNRKL